MNSELGLDEVFARMEPGAIETIAGVGYVEGVPARDAPAGWPMGIARNAAGDLFVVDYWGHRIWRIDVDGVLHSVRRDRECPAIRVTAARLRRPGSTSPTTCA